MLTLYRRHTATCGHTSRRYRRCQCPIWAQGTLGGEEIRRSLDLTSWDAAEKVLHAWKEAGKIGAEGQRAVSVEEAVEKYLRDAATRLAANTLDLYRRGLKHLLAWCKAERIETLRRLDIEALRRYRETWTCRPVTAARRIDRLRIFLNFCVESGWVEKNAAKALKPPEVRYTGKTPFTNDELRKIIEASGEIVTRGTYGKENAKRVKAFIYILRYTGLRISDAANLDESKVVGGRVFLRTEKNGAFVWIPIPEFVVDALREVPRVGRFYFQTGNAKPKTVRNGWDRTIRTVLALAGIGHGSAHCFRTTLAVELLSKGVPVETVAAILGNTPAIVMKHYAPFVKARQDALEEAVRRVWDEPQPRFRVIEGGAS